MVRNASKPVGGVFDRDVVVLRLIRQRHEADEAVRLVLQRAQLPQMIHAVGERFDVAESIVQVLRPPSRCQVRWTSRYSSADSLPRAMARADFLAENLRAAAGERIESGFLQFAQRLLDGFLRQPGEVQDFNGGEAFELQLAVGTTCRSSWPRGSTPTRFRGSGATPSLLVQRAQRLEHVRVVAERQRGMQSADDVQFRDAELQRLARLLDDLRRSSTRSRRRRVSCGRTSRTGRTGCSSSSS